MSEINTINIISLYYGNIYGDINNGYVRNILCSLDEITFIYLKNLGYMEEKYHSKRELEILQQAIIGLIDE